MNTVLVWVLVFNVFGSSVGSDVGPIQWGDYADLASCQRVQNATAWKKASTCVQVSKVYPK